MAELWKAWKTKSRFPTLSTAPWKSRKGGEISTFPQPRLFLVKLKIESTKKNLKAVEKWKFRPGYKDGKPVTVAATIEVNFRLL